MEYLLVLVLGGYFGYDYGKDVQAEQCRAGIHQLQTIITESNENKLNEQSKLQSRYEEALVIQSITAANLQKDYNKAVSKIEEIKNEETGNCLFEPIDYSTLNRLREAD